MKLIDSFLDYMRYEQNCSQLTIIAYKEDLSQFYQFVEDNCDEFDVTLIDSDIIRDWVMLLMSEKFTATSVNRKLSALRSFYKYLLRKSIVTADPLRKIVGPKNKRPLPVFLREKEMNELMDDVDYGEGFIGVRDHLIIEMFYMTGMRRAELIGLRDVDIDFSGQLIKVTGKRDKQRLIPFGKELEDSMRKYLAERKAINNQIDQSFFVDVKGGPLSPGQVYRIVQTNLSKVVTQKKRSPHVLRHTFATTMLNHDAQLGAVKELLGHSSLATTQIYTHTTFEELKKTYKQAHPRA
ncbi:MAG: tyrosine recombinase XerC [Bacteroidales bacterium]|nr:tyrosine recombinase XerC [Bacteroidales bacterium]